MRSSSFSFFIRIYNSSSDSIEFSSFMKSSNLFCINLISLNIDFASTLSQIFGLVLFCFCSLSFSFKEP